MAMVERKIVRIDEDKCNGCGVCVDACHEGAIQMVDGKARLVSDTYCDGLGDCLGPCPTGAISIVTRPAGEYDEAAVARRMAERAAGSGGGGCPGVAVREVRRPVDAPAAPATPADQPLPCGCPGSLNRSLKAQPAASGCACSGEPATTPAASELMNWPVQLRLVPPSAPYLRGADLLLAADCAPVAVPDFHARFLRNRPVIIACPKLEDNEPQVAKLAEILRTARPASVTVVRMEVPCCGGLVRIANDAVAQAGLAIPVNVAVVGVDGAVADAT